MPKAFETWTVLPHEPLAKLAENLWRVVGKLPGMPLPRCMTIARRNDGRLVIHNPVAMEEEAMGEIESWGEVGYLVVPNGWHRLDARIFAERYPMARVVCPAGSRKRVEQVVRVDGSFDDYEPDDAVSFEHVEGVGESEGVMRVESDDGVTLVFTDLLFNLPHLRGPFGFVYRLVGSTGGPKVTRIARWFVVKDEARVRAHLERLADVPGLLRVIPGHGDMISSDAAGTLRAVAAEL